jgi:oligoendopeptidase F
MADATMTKTLPHRSEVAVEHTWNAESVFADRAAFQQGAASLVSDLSRAEQFKGRLSEGPGVLADWLALYEDLFIRGQTLYVYGSMAKNADVTDQEAAALEGQAIGAFGRVFAAVAFTDPELLAIGEDTLKQWMAQEPRLAHYQHYFDNLFRRQAHVRSADVEEVLGLLAEPAQSVMGTREALVNADLEFRPAHSSTGEEFTVAPSSIDSLLLKGDRELRRTAWESYADGFLKTRNTLASNLGVLVKLDVMNSRAHRYDSALEAALFESNIPSTVFTNLIDTYQKNLPTWHRYWRVRRKALGVDTLHPYDIWAPLTSTHQHVPYEQGVEWLIAGLAPLGKEYGETMRRGMLTERWVDRYPNQGKGQAEFSSGAPGTHPFIMMNYAENIESLSTLTHEMGHSMHSYLIWQNQPLVYSDYSIFIAEVASNFHQAMVRAYLLDTNKDRDFQIAILEEAMSNFHRYFFIMPTLARFELEMHQRIERGDAAPADELNKLMADLFEEGYGGEMSIDRDRVGITWAQFMHLYAPFYVYQYATGISAANALAKRILDGTPGTAEKYLDFLKVGSSVYPLDALKIAGIDMTSPEPVNEAFAVLSGMVDRLEELTA